MLRTCWEHMSVTVSIITYLSLFHLSCWTCSGWITWMWIRTIHHRISQVFPFTHSKHHSSRCAGRFILSRWRLWHRSSLAPGSGWSWVWLTNIEKSMKPISLVIIGHLVCCALVCLIYPYILIILKGCWSKFLYPQTAILREQKKLLSRTFRELHVYLSRAPCWATTPLMKICSPPAKLRQRSTDHFLIAIYGWSDLTMGVPAPSVAKNVKLLPAPGIWLNLRMPCLKRGVLQTLIAAGITESLLRTDCCFFARFTDAPSTCTLNFARSWKLGCCIWSLFLETSKSIIRQWQRQV